MSIILEGIGWLQRIERRSNGHVVHVAFQDSVNPVRLYVPDDGLAQRLGGLSSPAFYRFRFTVTNGRYGFVLHDFDAEEVST